MAPPNCFADGPANHPLRAIRGRYRKFGLHPIGDGRGVIDIQEIPHCVGREVWIRPDIGTRRLSLSSHIRAISLNDLKTRGLVWDMCLGGNGKPRTWTRGGSCMVSGNSKWRSGLRRGASFVIYTLWRSAPITMWRGNINEISCTYDGICMESYDVGGTPWDILKESESARRELDYLEAQGAHVPS